MACVQIGPQKAGKLASVEACNLRQVADRHFEIAAIVIHLLADKWVDYEELMAYKKAGKKK